MKHGGAFSRPSLKMQSGETIPDAGRIPEYRLT